MLPLPFFRISTAEGFLQSFALCGCGAVPRLFWMWKGAAGFVTAFEATLDALEPPTPAEGLRWMAFWHLQVLLGGGYAVFSGAGTFLTWHCGPCKKESQPVCTCSRKLSTTHIYIFIYLHTSSTAQGGGGSFKNRKPIGELGCCESGMAERSH